MKTTPDGTDNTDEVGKKKYQIDCNAYTSELVESDTIRAALEEGRIVKFEMEEDGRIKVTEMCDDYFGGYLTRAQLRALADELKELADSV